MRGLSVTLIPRMTTDATSPPPRVRRKFDELGLLVVVIVMAIAMTVYGQFGLAPGQANKFLNTNNLISGIATPMSYYAIMAMGMTLVVIAGGIDISVGSVMALAGFVTAWTLQQFTRDASWYVVGPVSLLVPLGVGLVCGLFNGAAIVGLRMHPFIVTLGTLSIYRGIVNVLPTGEKSLPRGGAPMPDASLTQLFDSTLLGLRLWPLIVTLLIVAMGWVFLRYTIAGRHVYAVGSNEEAARLCGVNVGRTKLMVYAVAGMTAGLAGLVSLGYYGAATADGARGYELQVVAATVIGGASLAGGRGSALGALLGTLVLAMIENAIQISGIDQSYKLIIVGLSIIIAVAVDRLSDSLRRQ
jgi:ribose/xylose/arabinose/galactoside ABC-type transport system permease subunit